jgi:UDP-glucose 4-epimerase
MSVLITGVAGFIGCNLAKYFLSSGRRVYGVDNFCIGSMKNIEALSTNPLFDFHEIEITDLKAFQASCSHFHKQDKITEVWHLAANSDIPAGVGSANVDLKDTFMTTFSTLEVMKKLGIPKLFFASSSAIYGDFGEKPITEEIGPLLPISNYGAMKLASEAAISAAVESYLEQAFLFRFPNVIGVPATHGVILDFVRKLHSNSSVLDVLGDGTQQKGYLHVDELIDAMLFIRDNAKESLAFYNIGTDDDGAAVKFIAEQTVINASPKAGIIYGKGKKGWVGDVPRFTYSIDKLRALGWAPKLDSCEAVIKAINEVIKQESTC